jgi:hypothetical protein
MPAGRPTLYCLELADFICDRIATGESVRGICGDPDMPNAGTVFEWLSKHKEFAERYARAREQQAEKYASEIIAIADENPTCAVPDPDGGTSTRVDAAAIQRNKLRVDARKWIACKLLPKVYGDRIQQELTGADGGPVQFVARSILDKPE